MFVALGTWFTSGLAPMHMLDDNPEGALAGLEVGQTVRVVVANVDLARHQCTLDLRESSLAVHPRVAERDADWFAPCQLYSALLACSEPPRPFESVISRKFEMKCLLSGGASP